MNIIDNLDPRYRPAANLEDFNYFAQMQEDPLPDSPVHTAKMWDRRAEAWKKERITQRKGDERVLNAVRILEQRGILNERCDVVDIGCGPGRFAAAFAKKAHSVLGLDLSEKMVEHGMEHIRTQGLKNAALRVCDFQTLDIKGAGYQGAFDLVFSSMTPAVHGIDGLIKSMEMSRAWCCNVTHLSRNNHLKEQILLEVFGRKPPRQWNGRWFYSLFNVLFLMGYSPETSYETRHQELVVTPDEEFAAYTMEHMLPETEQTAENARKILEWLKAHADADGHLLEITESGCSTILWDVREKTERPEYRLPEPGI